MYAAKSLLVLASLGVGALGATYSQSDSHTGTGFLKSFTHEAISDPTHGRVYVGVPCSTASLPSVPCCGAADRYTRFDPWLTCPISISVGTTSISRPPWLRTSPLQVGTRSSSGLITPRHSVRVALGGTRSGCRATSSIQRTSPCRYSVSVCFSSQGSV